MFKFCVSCQGCNLGISWYQTKLDDMRMTQWHTHVLVIGHISKQEEGCWNSAWCQSFYLKILQMKWRRCTRGRDDTSDTTDWDIWYWDLFVKIKRGKKPRSGHSVAETSNWGLIRTVFIQARFMEPPLSQHSLTRSLHKSMHPGLTTKKN